MMNRFVFILALSAMLFSSFCEQEKVPTQKPNIVLINIDDLGWRDFGYMGSEFYSTPNIDQLSKQGMVFTNGYAAAANCAPSRACLMTGLWPTRHGIYTVGSSERGKSKDRKLIPIKNTTTLEPSFLTIPKVLHDQGYTTCHAGKWHLSDRPEIYGFDKNIGGGHNGHPRSYYPPYGNVKLEAKNGEYLTDLVMTEARSFVESARDPFFLYYSPYAVHTPIQGIDSLKSKYENKAPWNDQDNIDYATMIENLDRNIGLLISTLEKKGVMENTVIVLTSDNGGLFGITYQPPLRAGKGSYYEGGIRVPFLFSWKGHIRPNSRSEYPITNLDIFPTILDLLKLDVATYELDGQSLLPVLKGVKNPEPRPLFWHFPIYLQAYNKRKNQNRDPLFRTRPGSVVRYGDWKLHYYFEDNGIELYNLKEDVSEQKNLAEDFPEKKEALYSLLKQWQKETNAPIPSALNPEYEAL